MKNIKQSLSLFLLVVAGIFSILNLSIPVAADSYFDSYGNLPWKYEIGRLDNFSIYLRENAETVGYIIFYVGEKDSYKKVNQRINRSVKYLSEYGKFDKSRIVVVYAGRKENTQFILQPYDKDSPLPKKNFPEGKIINSEIKSLNN